MFVSPLKCLQIVDTIVQIMIQENLFVLTEYWTEIIENNFPWLVTVEVPTVVQLYPSRMYLVSMSVKWMGKY